MTFREWWESEAYCIALPSRTALEGTTEALICAVASEAWKVALEQPPLSEDDLAKYAQRADPDVLENYLDTEFRERRFETAEEREEAREFAAEMRQTLRMAAQALGERTAKWRAWWLGMADEAASAGTQSGDYNAHVYREIVADFDRTVAVGH